MNDNTIPSSVGYDIWRNLNTFCTFLFVYHVKIALLRDVLRDEFQNFERLDGKIEIERSARCGH